MTRLSFASSAMKGVVSRPSSYGVVDCARVDSRKTITTLRRLVSGVGTYLVHVGSERARKDTAARHAASGAVENRPTFRVGRCQPWVMRRVTTAGPMPA